MKRTKEANRKMIATRRRNQKLKADGMQHFPLAAIGARQEKAPTLQIEIKTGSQITFVRDGLRFEVNAVR